MRSKFKNRVMLSLVVGMGAVALGGCSTVRVEMPESTLKLPDRFDAVDTPVSRGADLAHWWQVFNDPVLTAHARPAAP